MFRCSECSRVIGPMLDRNGRPTMFICHRTGNAAEMVPNVITARKTPPRPKDPDAIDLSQRARKAKKKEKPELQSLVWSTDAKR